MAGDAVAGDPVAGDPVAGDPAAGDPLTATERVTRWSATESAAVLKDGGWLALGDIARFSGGLLYMNARARDMICVNAENVSPPEVEHVLEDHPDVTEAAVLAVEHVTGEPLPRTPSGKVLKRELRPRLPLLSSFSGILEEKARNARASPRIPGPSSCERPSRIGLKYRFDGIDRDRGESVSTGQPARHRPPL